MKIGAQLFTVREHCKTLDDFANTLKKVADIGYSSVQVSGTCAYEPEWLAEQLRANGLECAITHFSAADILQKPAEVAEAHKKFGCKYIGIGYFPGGPAGLSDLDGFIKKYTAAAEILHEHGEYLMYHNHSFELAHDADGKTYLEKIAAGFPPELLGLTIDSYWIQVGGGDPAEWIERYSGRVPCIHLKDLIIVEKEQRMAPVGSGNINFERVISAAERAGTKYLLVEQDNSYGRDPFGELEQSYKYLRSLGLN